MYKAVIAGAVGALAVSSVSFAQTCPAYTYTLTNGTTADANQVMANFNTVRTCLTGQTPVMRNYIAGLTLWTAGSSSTYQVAPGQATDNANVAAMTLASVYAKTTSAWTAGSGAGSLDTGSVIPDVWYHVFLIERADTGAVDVLISLSPTAPTLPSPYTLFRRIGAMKTDSSSHWRGFTQVGEKFLWWSPPAVDFALNISTTTPQSYPANVPPGVSVDAIISLVGYGGAAGVNYIHASSPMFFGSGQGAALTYADAGWMSGSTVGAVTVFVTTNPSTQYFVAVSSATSTTIAGMTLGWVDPRGKNN